MAMIFFRLQRKLVKIKSFLKLQNQFFLHVQLGKSWLVKYFFGAPILPENQKHAREKKPVVNSFHVLGIHSPLYLGLQP